MSMRLGMFKWSGWYSLMLLFRVCIFVLSEASFSELLLDSSPDALLAFEYALRFGWFAKAEASHSPLLVTKTDSAIFVGSGCGVSLEGGRPCSRFQGPGESPDSNGDGSGVKSPIAVMIGLGTLELLAEPKLWARAADLKLGVRDTGFRLGADDLRDKERGVCFAWSEACENVEAPLGPSKLGPKAEKSSLRLRSELAELGEAGC